MMTTLLLSIIVVSWIAVALGDLLSDLIEQLISGPSKSYELVPVRVKDQSDRNSARRIAYRNQ
ncbi:MAG: hypothetical protein AAFQ95_02940 [Cyanobacteria bacterium J06621_3]